jgi:hypothetical protein
MAFTFPIKAVPGSGRQCCVLDKSGAIKCFLKSQPEDGKANKELIAFLASSLDVKKTQVLIIQGELSRSKVIKVAAKFDLDEMKKRLGLERQLMLE